MGILGARPRATAVNAKPDWDLPAYYYKACRRLSQSVTQPGRDMEQPQILATPMRRAGLALGAVALLAVWGVSAIPVAQNWNNPNEDGFSFVPLFWVSLTLLPLGISILAGVVSGSENG